MNNPKQNTALTLTGKNLFTTAAVTAASATATPTKQKQQ